MTRTATLLAITVLSSIATPFVVNATGAKQADAAPMPILASVEATPAIVAEDASCARRVRVVYRGYREAAGACFAERN